MDSAPRRVADAWHGTFRGSQHTRAGNRNEPKIMASMKKECYVLSLFDAGLAESKTHRWLATSPDGIGALDMQDLVNHLDSKFHPAVAPLRSSRGGVHVVFEYKTFAAANTTKYEQLVAAHGTDKQWLACSVNSDDFKKFVPNVGYRRQLVHALATFGLPGIVFVAATERGGNPIISKTLVVAEAATIERHVRELEVLAVELMGWVHDGPDAQAPNWMAIDVAQLLESHQSVWWSTRMVVLESGPMHPIETMRLSLVAMYNKYVRVRAWRCMAFQVTLLCCLQYHGRSRRVRLRREYGPCAARACIGQLPAATDVLTVAHASEQRIGAVAPRDAGAGPRRLAGPAQVHSASARRWYIHGVYCRYRTPAADARWQAAHAGGGGGTAGGHRWRWVVVD